MATQIGVDHKRGDLILVSPFDIIVNEQNRGRHFAPDEEAVVDLALSLHENHQQQPIKCRRIEHEGKKNMLFANSGFTRIAAARLLREGFKHPETGETVCDPDFMLQTTLTTGNEFDAFTQNIVENAHRRNTSPIDDAHNFRRLREVYGKSDAEIARLYHYAPAKVSRFNRLLEHSEEVQLLIHEGQLSVQAALDLLDIPDEQLRKQMIENATKSNGKMDGQRIRTEIREHILRDNLEDSIDEAVQGMDLDGETSGEGAKKVAGHASNGSVSQNGNGKASGAKAAQQLASAKPRSMKDLRKFFEARNGGKDAAEKVDPAIGKFCKTVCDFINGKVRDTRMDKALKDLLAATPAEELAEAK